MTVIPESVVGGTGGYGRQGDEMGTYYTVRRGVFKLMISSETSLKKTDDRVKRQND